MVLSIAGLYFFSFFQRVAVPGSIFNDIQSEMGISAPDVTRLGAIYLFIYASMQPFAGYLTDRFGGIKISLAGGLFLCAGSVLFPLSYSVWGLYMSRGLVGLGASVMYLCMVKETDHYFGGKNFATIFGFLCLLGYSGGLVATIPFRTLVEQIGWRNSSLTAAVPVCIILVFALLMKCKVSPDPSVKTKRNILKGILEVFKNRYNYPLLITIPVSFTLYFSLQAVIGAKFLQDFRGISSLQASKYTFMMMLSTVVTMSCSGYLSKLMGNKRKVFLIYSATANLLAMVTCLCGIILALPSGFFLLAFIMSATTAGLVPVNASFTRELNPPYNVAISIGVVNAVVYCLVAVASQFIGQVLGFFKDQATVTAKATIYPVSAYVTLFSILLGVAVISFMVALFSRETNGINIFGHAEE